MDITPLYFINSKEAEATEDLMEKRFIPVMRKASDKNGWTFADSMRTKSDLFKEHGICAFHPEQAAKNPEENGAFPRKVAGNARKFEPFSPLAYLPYKTRTRWFRTPNDAYLTSFYVDQDSPADPLNAITLQAGYGGAFHPTAEGQAYMADEVFQSVWTMLKSSDLTGR